MGACLSAQGRKPTALKRLAKAVADEATGRDERGKRLARRFVRHVQDVAIAHDVPEDALGDFANETYMQRAALRVLEVMAPGYLPPADLNFQVSVTKTDERGTWIRTETNVDFAAATAAHNTHFLVPGPICDGHVLSAVVNVQENLRFASLYSSDLCIDRLQSMLIHEQCREFLRIRGANAEQLRAFQQDVLGSSHPLAEAVTAANVV